MPHYEFMTIATMAASASHLTSLFRGITRLVKTNGGVLRKVENLGLRPLAYRIRAHRKYNTIGRFIRFSVQANPQLMSNIEKALLNDEEIVRHIVIKKPLTPQGFGKTEFDPKAEGKTDSDLASIKEREESRALVDFYAAKTLLSSGLLSKEELKTLPRHRPDPNWDGQRQKLTDSLPDQVVQEILAVDARLGVDQAQMPERIDAESKLVEELTKQRRAAIEAKAATRMQFLVLENQRAIYRHWVYTLTSILKRVKKQMKKEFEDLQSAGEGKSDEEKRQIIVDKFRQEARTALKRYDDEGIEAILKLTKDEPNEITQLVAISGDNFTWKRRSTDSQPQPEHAEAKSAGATA